MAKAKNSYETMARASAKRIEAARDQGQQLTFLADEAGAPPVDTTERKAGRPQGAQNKGSSELRKWLAANGYRMPEEIMAEMAGLNSRDPAIVSAMAQTEQVLNWAFAGAKVLGGKRDGQEILPTPHQRLAMFNSIYTVMLRAADALLPYGTPKANPDERTPQAVVFQMPAAPADPAELARDVTPAARVISGRMMPRDAAWKVQQDQQVSDGGSQSSDDETRTEGSSD